METDKRYVVAPINRLGRAIRAVLTPDLLRPEYRGGSRPFAGHCYVATEAYYHMVGGKNAGYKPMKLRHENSTHWYLVGPNDLIVDLTAEQFETPVPYSDGRGCGFLTSAPSLRARTVIDRVHAANPDMAPM